MNPMNQRIKCRSDGCLNEVFFKTVEGSASVTGAYIDPIERRASGIRSPVVGRGSPAPYGHSHRYSTGGGSTVVSQYCKQHTCIHFLRDEGCTNKKPLHDTVCANHARCPIPECTQARAQFLDPGYDPNLHSVPRYVRFEFCADHKCILRSCPRRRTSPKSTFCQAHSCHHEGCQNQSQDQRNCCEKHQCKAGSCRTIVEGNYPYCALHIKCEIASCGRARHSMASNSDEYLAFCTEHATCEVGRCREIRLNGSSFCGAHTCQERDCKRSANSRPFCNDHSCQDADCPYPRAWAPQLKDRDKFCPLHTCRSQGCQEYVDSRAIFCKKHGCSKKRCISEAVVEQLCLEDLKAQYMAQGELIATRKHSMSISSNRGSPFSPHHTGSSTPVPFPPLHSGMVPGPPRSSAPTPIPTPGGGVTYRDRDRGDRGLAGGGVSSRQSHQPFFQIPPRSGTPVGNTLRGGGGIVNLNKHDERYRTLGYPPGTETSTDEHDEDDDDDDDENENEGETSDNENESNKEDESHDEDRDRDADGDEGLQEGVSTMHLSTGALPPAVPQAPPAPALLGPPAKDGGSRGGSSNGNGKGGPRHRKSGNTHTTNTTSTNTSSTTAQSESESEDLNFPDPRDRDFGIGAAPDPGFVTLSTSLPSTSPSEESNSLAYPPPAPELQSHMFPVQQEENSTPPGKGKGITGREQKANSGKKKNRKGRGGGKVNGYGHSHGPPGGGEGYSQHFGGAKEQKGWWVHRAGEGSGGKE